MRTLEAYKQKPGTDFFFKINDESWQILVKFLLDHSIDIQMKEEVERWSSLGTGYIVNETDAQEVADHLQRLVREGVVQKHEKEVRIQYPGHSCEFCNGSGFNDRDEKECKPCHGEGIFRPVDFSERMVKEFIDFLRNSGGFMDFNRSVLFPEIYGPNWKDQFSSKEAIHKLFQEIRIDNEEIIEISPALDMAQNRLTLFVKTRNVETGLQTRMIIDFITGNPTWEQFIDVTYDSGVNTELKIIVYDNGCIPPKYGEPGGFCLHIAMLVEINNRCGVRTLLINANIEIKKNETTLNYEIHQVPNSIFGDFGIPETKKEATETLPTKKQIQEAEFWVFYYQDSIVRELIDIDRDMIGGWGPIYPLSSDLEAQALWNEKGLSMNVVGESGSEILKRIWNEGKDTLTKNYPGCEIDFFSRPEEKDAISVIIKKIPLSDLLNMDPRDKWDHAAEVYREEPKFVDIIEEILATIDGEDEED